MFPAPQRTPLRWEDVWYTPYRASCKNRPPPCSLLVTVKRDIGRPVAQCPCLAISSAVCRPFLWPVRQCIGPLRVWFLVDDHY
ncbi:hypothetical protein TNCV_4276801 [Trichonephila clavipes]|nr:hypothetical protein TNCV_4276801 [Trichonephila clavipes]